MSRQKPGMVWARVMTDWPEPWRKPAAMSGLTGMVAERSPELPKTSQRGPFRAHWFTALSIVNTKASGKHEMTGPWKAM